MSKTAQYHLCSLAHGGVLLIPGYRERIRALYTVPPGFTTVPATFSFPPPPGCEQKFLWEGLDKCHPPCYALPTNYITACEVRRGTASDRLPKE